MTSKENEAQEGQGKCPGHAEDRSGSLSGLCPTPTHCSFPHSMVPLERPEGVDTGQSNGMVVSEESSHVQERAMGKREGTDKQHGCVGWLLRGIQFFKGKLFKDQIILGYVWVQERVCFLFTSL